MKRPNELTNLELARLLELLSMGTVIHPDDRKVLREAAYRLRIEYAIALLKPGLELN